MRSSLAGNCLLCCSVFIMINKYYNDIYLYRRYLDLLCGTYQEKMEFKWTNII